MQKVELKWEIGWCEKSASRPETYWPATVPGAVQLDYARAHGWEPYWVGGNYRDYAWMEDRYWVYRAPLNFALTATQTATLVLQGVDYRYQVCIDGETLLEGEGLYTAHRLDVTRFAGRACQLEIVLFPVPKKEGVAPGRREAAACCKPPVSYGWDWHPRLIPLGLWDEAYLELVGSTVVYDWTAQVTMADDLRSACVEVAARLNRAAPVRLTLFDTAGNPCAQTQTAAGQDEVRLDLSVASPALWWPAEYGEQPLYRLRLEAGDNGEVYTVEKSIGFRRIRLVMNQGAWEQPSEFPKTQSTEPITLEINGRRLFAKGSNWVNADIFPSQITDDRYRELLQLAVAAHMNLLRVWGGGLVNRAFFFEECDRLGLLVWQEFPLACNQYPDDPAYLAVLEQEATSLLRRLRSHPCLALWCGGNELLNGWSWMTTQSHALRLLNSLCYQYDRYTPFLPSSPVYGMAHGHYCNVDENGRECYAQLLTKTNTAYTEFGCPGASSGPYIRRFLPEEEYRQPGPSEGWVAHHGFGAWDLIEDTWLRVSEATYYFGGYTDTDDLTDKLARVQAQSMFEEMRRQWPRCSMALNWCFNEPWPTAANNSLFNWPCQPKPAYEAVKAALRGQMISLRLEKRVFELGEELHAELWMHNDLFTPAQGDTVTVYLDYDGKTKPLLTWECDELPPTTNRKGPAVNWTLPHGTQREFQLRLECARFPERCTVYTCMLRVFKEEKADALNI